MFIMKTRAEKKWNLVYQTRPLTTQKIPPAVAIAEKLWGKKVEIKTYIVILFGTKPLSLRQKV